MNSRGDRLRRVDAQSIHQAGLVREDVRRVCLRPVIASSLQRCATEVLAGILTRLEGRREGESGADEE